MSDITKSRMGMIGIVVHTFRFIYSNYDVLLKIWLCFFMPTIFIMQLVTKTFAIPRYPLLYVLPLILNTPLQALGAGATIDLVRARTYGYQFSIRKTLKEGWYKLILTSYLLVGLRIVEEILKIFNQKPGSILSLLYFIATIVAIFMFQVVRTTGKWGINAYTKSAEIAMANKLMVFLYWILNGIIVIGIAIVLKRFINGDLIFETPYLVVMSFYYIFQFSLSTVLFVNLTECPKRKEKKIDLVKPVT